jgi:preprotein translocase subunit SecB
MIKPPLDVNAASRLSSSLRIRDIVCVGLEAKHLATEEAPSGSTLGWETPPVQVFWDLEGDVLKVILPFSVFIDAHQHEKADKEKVVRLAEITVAMRIEYAVTRGESWSEEDVPHYVGVCSYLHAWPYFRADVQSLTAKLGYPPLVLPVIVSGHAAKQATVTRLSEVKNAPPLPRRRPRPKKISK